MLQIVRRFDKMCMKKMVENLCGQTYIKEIDHFPTRLHGSEIFWIV